jgi:hypothetical protein
MATIKKPIKKACSGTSLYPKKSSVSSKLKAGGSVKKKTVPKAQLGRLIDKAVSRESNRMLDRVVKKAPGMTDKAVDYGKVVLTDAQKAKNAEILKNPGSATRESWSKAKKIAQKEADAKSSAESLKYWNKPMLKPIGSASTETLGKIAKNIKKSASPKAKDGKWIQKAVNPAHKGYCTPMTKATCTPKRKALAKTFKAMAKKRK